MTLRAILHAARRQAVADALARHGGNCTRAARELGVGRNYLYRLVPRLGLSIADARTVNRVASLIDMAEVRAHRRRGVSWQTTAELLGVDPKTLRKVRQAEGGA